MAESATLALDAAKAVFITYKKHKKPILTIADALKYPNEVIAEDEDEVARLGLESNIQLYPEDDVHIGDGDVEMEVDDEGTTTIKGEFEIGAQHHFHIETQVSKEFIWIKNILQFGIEIDFY